MAINITPLGMVMLISGRLYGVSRAERDHCHDLLADACEELSCQKQVQELRESAYNVYMVRVDAMEAIHTLEALHVAAGNLRYTFKTPDEANAFAAGIRAMNNDNQYRIFGSREELDEFWEKTWRPHLIATGAIPADVEQAEVLEFKCVISSHNGQGEPEMLCCVVLCTRDERDNGEHYDAARNYASERDYECDGIVYDEGDGPDWLFEHFDWDTAARVSVRN